MSLKSFSFKTVCIPYVQFSVALRPQRPYGLLGTGSPGCPPRFPHSWWALLPYGNAFDQCGSRKYVSDVGCLCFILRPAAETCPESTKLVPSLIKLRLSTTERNCINVQYVRFIIIIIINLVRLAVTSRAWDYSVIALCYWTCNDSWTTY